ncbi:hypothetical protein NPIL_321411 [Nephila pilipes]|uniref:Uncharacterized protein n=1 Tax=Nephila pilipes TaxID=299642 RepID=A0A8X6N9K4_NEPPI|nr:hypothetical protein NPIL_321411 [Nephila pilipes]
MGMALFFESISSSPHFININTFSEQRLIRRINKIDTRNAFHMPQAVIDELSQVLEKRKPSLDKKTPMHVA